MSDKQQFLTLSAAVQDARYHGLRGVDTVIINSPTPEASGYTVRAIIQVGADSHYTAHGTGPTIERAESAAIARALLIALGLSVGGNGAPA